MPEMDFFKKCRPASSRTETMHLQMYRGDTLQFKAFILDGTDAVDVTGGFFWFTVKSDINDKDADAVIQKTIGAGIQVLNAPLGYIMVTVDPMDTLLLSNEETVTYNWDLQYEDAFGVITTVFIGKLTVIQDVTNFRAYNIGAGAVLGVGIITGQPLVAGVNAVQNGTALQNEVQSVHVTGAGAGTFTLTVDDPNNPGNPETTTPLAWNATAAAIETALENDISFIDDVTVAGATDLSLGAITVSFDGAAVANLNFQLMAMDVSLLS